MTNEDKELLAKFDGWVETGKEHPFDNRKGKTFKKEGLIGVKWLDVLNYDKDWNLIHSVIQKIESIKTAGLGSVVTISTKSVMIRTCSIDGIFIQICQFTTHLAEDIKHEKVVQEIYGFTIPDSKRIAVLKAIVEFVKWYNNSKYYKS